MSPTRIVAIVNVTPDSFSEAVSHLAVDVTLERIQHCLDAGAEVIDIGAESTRPGATALSAEEEWARLGVLLPEAIALVHQRGALVSLDSYHPETAVRALALGVDWINDVGGGQSDAMVAALKNSSASLVIMHSLSVPADPAVHLPKESDPVSEMRTFFTARLEALDKQGIDSSRVILDPGIGFGKTAVQSLRLLHQAETLRIKELPLLIGHSRKSFLTLFSDAPATERDALTLAFSGILMLKAIDYLRVHDVASHMHLKQQLAAEG